MTRAGATLAGTLIALGSGALAIAGIGMTGHMIAHMAAVAVAAPALAWGLAGSAADPAERWPTLVQPLGMALVELIVVWSWHLPAVRAAADASVAIAAIEQAVFLATGFALWSAVLGTRRRSDARAAAGVAALLLTSMHMTLLGALIALAPRPLFATMAMHGGAAGLSPLVDQQLGGTMMLLIGGASYMAGGLAMLGRLLRSRGEWQA